MNTKQPLTLARAACLALGASCLLLTGCRSVTTTTPAIPKVPASPPPVSGRVIPDTMAAEASAEAVRHFNFRVTCAGAAPADAVRQTVEGRLAADGYKLNAEAPDLLVHLAVRSAEFDRAGEYLRYEGTVEAGVNRTWDSKRLGFDNLSVRGKRGLGADEAMRNLTVELAAATAAFVAKAARPEQAGLAALDVTIRRPWLTARDPQYAQQFISAVRQLRGIVYCAMVAHDYDTRVLTFRIAYLADAVPEGLLNRLATVKVLNIKPRQ